MSSPSVTILVILTLTVATLAIKHVPEAGVPSIFQLTSSHVKNNVRRPVGFSAIGIESSIDGSSQPAYFRGPNITNDACLSEMALADIDDAVQYAIDHGQVDRNNVFVVGASGGGYATLAVFLSTRHDINTFLAWVPISDLVAWFHQSQRRNTEFAENILACTSAGSMLDEQAARKRSPLYMDIPLQPTGALEIYAGIDDGYHGSVPISHSILFYNRMVRHFDPVNGEALVGPDDMARLLTRAMPVSGSSEKIGGRDVLYARETHQVALTIFDGDHEMLARYTIDRLKELVR